MTYETIRVERGGSVARVVCDRPEVRNALDARMIAELTEAFDTLSADASVRAVALRGEGAAFSGGADINYMRASLDLGEAENEADARRLSAMFAAIDNCAPPVVARVHGAALGGGSGSSPADSAPSTNKATSTELAIGEKLDLGAGD